MSTTPPSFRSNPLDISFTERVELYLVFAVFSYELNQWNKQADSE